MGSDHEDIWICAGALSNEGPLYRAGTAQPALPRLSHAQTRRGISPPSPLQQNSGPRSQSASIDYFATRISSALGTCHSTM
jgi:hypothetical protein